MSRRALSSSSFGSSFFASSLVDAVASRYRSGSRATKRALANRSESPLKKSVKPRHACRTRTPGPLPFFGTAKYPGTLPSGLLSSIIPVPSPPLGEERPNRPRALKPFAEAAGRPCLEKTEKWSGWDLNRRLYNRSPISTRLPAPLLPLDRSPLPYFEDENCQETLLNVEDYAIVPDSEPVIRGAHEPLDQSTGIVREFSDLVEDPAGDRSIELPQLANGRLGPDDLEGHQKPSSSFSCWWVRYLPALISRTDGSISFLVSSFSSWRSSRSLSRTSS